MKAINPCARNSEQLIKDNIPMQLHGGDNWGQYSAIKQELDEVGAGKVAEFF